MPNIENLISSEIAKTGYVLEHEIAQHLKSGGWSVISGKYYVDDIEDAPREMDLIAYRVTKFDKDEVELYTVLIISCKKSDDNIWALLARDVNLKDPNTDYWPLHAWSNDPALTYQLKKSGKAKVYHERMRALGVVDAVADPQVEVFAFQEMNKVSGVPKNDKAIFSAISSLVKAQAYEISSLPDRKKTRAVYQFNLVSIVGADMFRLKFSDVRGDIKSSKIDCEQYIARYIVSKKESFSRIRFITSKSFFPALDDYVKLHSANVIWFAEEHSEFYENIMEDAVRVKSLIALFYKNIKNRIKWLVEAEFKKIENFDEEPVLFWNKRRGVVDISYFETDEIEDWMDKSQDVRQVIGDALKKVYRYEGLFRINGGVPF